MESIKKSVDDLSLHFHKTMAEFQQNLQSAIPATSPTSNIASQFSSFRNFVMTALNSLQGQLELLSQQMDEQETRSRRKILLFHGVPETAKEDVPATVVKILKDHLQMHELSVAAISRCHRIGQTGGDKPRALLVKLCDQSVRNKIWFSKKNFKGTGITLGEFLTKIRHEAFVAARLQLGLSKSWTKNGRIIVIGSDGKRHSITTKAQLTAISSGCGREAASSVLAGPATVASKPHAGPSQISRSRRVVKK
ncbi:uncharacterized protein LOC120634791 [Pararge aegeria]|uniref:uncharacterized protein LOC120623264 n=1 Tax=Pararge aegeria TaxID=116150 RepID=UPI0019D0B017|nr:uncharacterized protein LOC120623264 [Pararge aegeria]XP_039748451.1 uncharacterized protein LOC120625444 [Pararge aegeria]XP_039750965.1 uncharacterized protein LOC120627157 [Pararge aegeria]XP_039755191.1 uncharacterized protein LOC120630106 [Pararge aegeria]XP_039761528.1 uncharacterized protein LOC120634791 [Pararge aegeria]